MPVTWTTVAAIGDGSTEGLIQAYGIASAVGVFGYSYTMNSAANEVVGVATFKGTGIAYVQTKSAASAPVAALTTPAMVSTPGNFVGLQTAGFSRANTVTDSKGNAIQTAWSITTGAVGACRYIENLLGGSGHTFTVTPTGGTDYCAIAASEFSGINTSSSLDQTVSALSATEPHVSGQTATTTQASELILGGGSCSHTSTVPVTAFTKHFVAGGVDNHWSTDTNWSSIAGGGNDVVAPTITDAVVFDVGSPDCTIDVASTCKTVTWSAYVHTLAVNASLTTAGNVTLGSGMTITGTGDLILTTGCTVTSNGKTWSGGVTLLGGNATQFAFGTFAMAGLFTCSTTGTSGAWLSGTLTIAGGLLTNTICSFLSTQATFILTGGTWSGSAGRMSNHLKFDGNVTISGTVTFSNATMIYVSGTITTTGSTVICEASNFTLNCTGMTFGTLRIVGSSAAAVTLLSALDADTMEFTFTTVNFAGTAGIPITCRTLTAAVGAALIGPLTASVVANIGAFAATVALSGSYTVTVASCVMTSIMTFVPNTSVVVTGITTSTATWTLNGSQPLTTAGLDLSGAAAGTGVGAGHAVVGTGTIILTGGVLKTHTVDAIEVNLQIAGNVSPTGVVLFGVGTITYVSGTVTPGTSTLSMASGTLNTAGMSWANITLRGTTVTLASALVATGTLTYPNGDFAWVGPYNITVGTLTNVNPTATRTVTWVHGITLTINTAFTIVHTGAGTIRLTWQTDVPGSTMQFIVMPGATINVKNVDPWDLDASAGQFIFTLNGAVHNSLNWSGVFTTVFIPATRVLTPPMVFRVLTQQMVTWIGDIGGVVWIE